MSDTKPTTFVIFGASGDLTRRKLIPALFNSYCKGRLPELFNIVGFARRPWDDAELRQVLQDELLAIWQADRRTVLFITHSLEEALVLGDRVVVMTARPGRLLESVEVPFERPRGPELREQPEFTALKAELWNHLKGEVEEYLDELRRETVGTT